jgi:hypothetical protein
MTMEWMDILDATVHLECSYTILKAMWVMRRWIMDDVVIEEGILAFGVVGSELGADPHSAELGQVSSYAMFLALIVYVVVEASVASALWYVSTAYMLPAPTQVIAVPGTKELEQWIEEPYFGCTFTLWE